MGTEPVNENKIMKLISFIENLVEDIVSLDACFKTLFQVDSVLLAVRKKEIPKEGQMGNIQYYFHGIGCQVTFPNKTVNFDYSPVSVCGGFSIYDLLLYMRSQGRLVSEEEIKRELKKLEETGAIFFPKIAPNPNLYYLKRFEQLVASLHDF